MENEILPELGDGSIDDAIRELKRATNEIKLYDSKWFNMERTKAMKDIIDDLNMKI